ncbi:hypothetical protein Hanom_Chr13g01232871 [Helianthus anomalus]
MVPNLMDTNKTPIERFLIGNPQTDVSSSKTYGHFHTFAISPSSHAYMTSTEKRLGVQSLHHVR